MEYLDETNTSTPAKSNNNEPVGKSSSRKVSSTSSTQKVSPSDQNKEGRVPFAWMVKECHIYKEEYKDCKSIRARFHQYFLGENQDCTPWKTDYDNCIKWQKKKDPEALQKVIESEKERVRKRLQAHYANDVWERRESPPENWNSELPDFIKKDYEHSFLHIKAEEIKRGEVNMDEIFADSRQLRRSCTIC